MRTDRERIGVFSDDVAGWREVDVLGGMFLWQKRGLIKYWYKFVVCFVDGVGDGGWILWKLLMKKYHLCSLVVVAI